MKMMAKFRLSKIDPRREGPRVAYVTTFPPTQCGIATFTEDLTRAVDRHRSLPHSVVIAINPDDTAHEYPPHVKFVIPRDNHVSYLAAAEYINSSDIDLVCIQHEFGIFGGTWGYDVVAFLKALHKPAVATLHTVLRKPEPAPLQITQEIARLCQSVVVMNSIASHVLKDTYGVPANKIRHIHHGAPKFSPELQPKKKARLKVLGRKVIATFGLINPGKGIEYAIQAMPQIVARHPDALYLILGETHPGVRRHSGESYREMLERTIAELGMQEHIVFDNRYLTKPQLISYLEATDIYVTPYLNPEQMVSGALCYAVAAGLPIVSTPYLYAFEMLGNGRGMIVDFRDPTGITDCVNLLLDSPTLRQLMAARTYDFGSRLLWDRIGAAHARYFSEVFAEHAAVTASRFPVPTYTTAPAAMGLHLSPDRRK
jgi:glycosyltransferase involved in cell wall biosynthesis